MKTLTSILGIGLTGLALATNETQKVKSNIALAPTNAPPLYITSNGIAVVGNINFYTEYSTNMIDWQRWTGGNYSTNQMAFFRYKAKGWP